MSVVMLAWLAGCVENTFQTLDGTTPVGDDDDVTTSDHSGWGHSGRYVEPPVADLVINEIMLAPDKRSAQEELKGFQEEYEAKYPKAVNCLVKDTDRLFTFMDFPGAHWVHLRSTNAIESTFATVKARTRVTKGLARVMPPWSWRLSL